MFGQRKTSPRGRQPLGRQPDDVPAGLHLLRRRQQGARRAPRARQPADARLAELPDKGFRWQEQWAVNLKCLDGTDAGAEVIYKPTTVGGIQAVAGLIEAVRDRLNGGQHDGKVSPIVLLEKDSYPHRQYGKRLDPAADDRRLDVAGRSGAGAPPAPASPPPRRATASPARRLTPMRT